jgi:xanthine dehydrogenase YagR molybdenum-binding subunit
MSIVERAKQTVQGAAQGLMKKAVELAPDRLIPGGKPDPIIRHRNGHVGKPASRVDGRLKVQGQARFAAEFAPEGLCYAALVFSTIAKGRIVMLDIAEAVSSPGVVLVMTHLNAPRLNSMPLFLTQPRRWAATTYRSCRMTACIGMDSQSQWCWPKRRSRPTMPLR